MTIKDTFSQRARLSKCQPVVSAEEEALLLLKDFVLWGWESDIRRWNYLWPEERRGDSKSITNGLLSDTKPRGRSIEDPHSPEARTFVPLMRGVRLEKGELRTALLIPEKSDAKSFQDSRILWLPLGSEPYHKVLLL